MNRFNVLVDNDIPPVFARVLRALLSTEMPEPRMVALIDVLPKDTPDVDWIEWIRQRDGEWIVLTGERRIRTVPAERGGTPTGTAPRPEHAEEHQVETASPACDPPLAMAADRLGNGEL